MKLMIYNQGKCIDRYEDMFFVTYDEHNNREIDNDIQIKFLNKYFAKHRYNRESKVAAMTALNQFSKEFNNLVKKLLTD